MNTPQPTSTSAIATRMVSGSNKIKHALSNSTNKERLKAKWIALLNIFLLFSKTQMKTTLKFTTIHNNCFLSSRISQ